MSFAELKKSIDHYFFTETKNKSTYYFSSDILLRAIGFLYFCVFYPLVFQYQALLGTDGILPITQLLQERLHTFESVFSLFIKIPSLFWFFNSDFFVLSCVYVGVLLSLLVILGFSNSLIMFVLWFLQLSFVHVGQVFWSYGWEYNLLEIGFLAMFLCPLISFDRSEALYSSSRVLNLLFKWVLFRFMLGSGLIKLRTDSCWSDFTCLFYHFETQPIPNIFSHFFHFLPKIILKFGVLLNHFVQIVIPFLIFIPYLSLYAGIAIVIMQVFILLSGNYAWLNYLAIIMTIPCFDDRFFARFINFDLSNYHNRLIDKKEKRVLYILLVFISLLSVKPIKNLLSSKQVMNTTYDRLHLVNSYGVFGYIGKKRYELILEGTDDKSINSATKWREYSFPCKLGSTLKSPCWSSPYHHRLAWQLWIASFGSIESNPWLMSLVAKLLSNNQTVLSLVETNPFKGRKPRFMRIKRYEYKFVSLFSDKKSWYLRKESGEYLNPVSLETPFLRRIIRSYNE